MHRSTESGNRFRLSMKTLVAHVLICAGLASGLSQAHTFNVTTAAELQSALDQSGDGGLYANETDFVDLAGGSYFTQANIAPFHYSSTAQHDLYLYGQGAGNPAVNPTVLDGAGASGRVLETHSTLGAVYLYYLTIQNGSTTVSDPPGGGGLSMNFNTGENGYVQVTNCIIKNNTSAGSFGGFSLQSGNHNGIFMSNSLITGNTAAAGAGAGAVYSDNGTEIDLYNNTFAKNTTTAAGASGGVTYNGRGLGVITNNIFWNNTHTGLVLNQSTAVLTNNDYGTLGGTQSPDPASSGNVSVTPRFVNAANGDFHLSGISPLLAAGVVLPVNAFDLDGNILSTSGRIDLGAYQETVFRDGFDLN